MNIAMTVQESPTGSLFSSSLAVPSEELFAWHERPGAFQRLQPPWEAVELVEAPTSVKDGSRAVLRVPLLGPIRATWVAEHRDYVAGRQFRDVQVRGPFARWVHTHRVTSEGPERARLDDDIEYALPMGFLGRWLGGASVRKKLRRMFTYRHATMRQDLAMHAKAGGTRPMKIAMTGASGLLGSALTSFLTTGGHEVVAYARNPKGSDEGRAVWDPAAGTIDASALEGVDAVIHLAGESIAGERWSYAKKARIMDSRVQGTRLLAETLAKLENPPKTFISASAIGFYGARGDEVLTEQSGAGTGFLAEVCTAWEDACEPARAAGIRVVNPRFGIVLSPAGGALKQMLPVFKFGGGGRIGSGKQYMSWVSIDDAVGAVHHALITDRVEGPVNVVAPQAATNLEFTKALGRALRRWTIFPLPAFMARLAFGKEMAEALLLTGARVEPRALVDIGYEFLQPDLLPALERLLGKTEAA